jgi:hypothetical protein
VSTSARADQDQRSERQWIRHHFLMRFGRKNQVVLAAPTTWGAAFPAHLGADVEAMVKVMPEATLAPYGGVFTVKVDGHQLNVPSRQYHPEPSMSAVESLSEAQRTILGCVFTRHHNGYVRQREVVPGLVEFEVAVPRLSPASW